MRHQLKALLSVIVILAVRVNGSTIPDLELSYLKLNNLSLYSKFLVEQALSTTGLISFHDVPNLDFFRGRLFDTATQCSKENIEKYTIVSLLPDGTSRRTFAALQMNNWKGILEGLEAIDECRPFVSMFRIVDNIMKEASVQFMKLLETLCDTDNLVDLLSVDARKSQQLMGFHDYLHQGTKISHLHVYNSSKTPRTGRTLEFHTDRGIFLAFLPSSLGLKSESKLLVKKNGDINVPKIEQEKNSIYFMLGEEAKSLLDPICKINLKPTLHALEMGSAEVRWWYGMMVTSHLDNYTSVEDTFNFGCSGNMVRTEIAKGSCAKGTQYCWMQCMPVDDQCIENDKKTLVCAADNGQIVQNGMCTDCSLKCLEKNSSSITGLIDSDDSFCSGYPTVMYMSGFSFNFSKRPNDACIVFLFDGLIADNRFKYSLFMLASLTLGFSVEYVVSRRRQLHARGSTHLFLFGKISNKENYRLKFVALYVVQVLAGYAAMLIAMAYSTPLFLSLVGGLAIGHLSFNFKAPVSDAEVCCQFMDDLSINSELQSPLLDNP